MKGRANMTNEQRSKCHAIIHAASTAAAAVGAGLAQLPCSDNAAIVPIQVAMVISLGKVFGITLSESAAISSLTVVATATTGRAVSQTLIGWLPFIGNAINAVTAASITEAAGWIVADDFSRMS
jgi:uncharacterized protein (DUF697 family)